MQAGTWRGGVIVLTFRVRGVGGEYLDINVLGLRLTVYRPDGSVFVTIPPGTFSYDPATKTAEKPLLIPESEQTGVWVAVWDYTDEFGNSWRDEFPFLVSDPAYR